MDNIAILFEKNLNDYALGEMQDYIELIYNSYKSSKDRADRKQLKKWYHLMITNYNQRAKSKIYSETLI